MLSPIVFLMVSMSINASKSHLSPDEYVMARMLRPGQIDAYTHDGPFQCIDCQTGEPFASSKDPCEV
jgi:hypothetical protein